MSGTEIKKKRHRLTDITFEHAGAHIALVGGIVGGPANQQTTLLWKSAATSDISEEEVRAALDSASGKTDVEKAKFNSEVRSALREELEKQFAGKYEWLYLEDFSDSQVVFSTDNGMYIVEYSLTEDDKYVFSDTAKGVEYKSILVENGAIRLSLEAQEKLSEGEYSLLTKALAHPETSERVNTTLASILEKETKLMQEEIQKAVDAAKAEMQAKIDGLQAALEKATADLAAVEAERQEALLKSRQEAVAKFDADGAEALVKATAALDDEAFATILKSLQIKEQAIADSVLMKQVSEAGSEAPAKVVGSRTVEIMKSL